MGVNDKMRTDVDLLIKQREFILKTFWNEEPFPELADGIVNLLDSIIDSHRYDNFSFAHLNFENEVT
jgi:hypothetical protein